MSFAQPLSIGLSESAVWKAVQAGRLHRVHQGVYAVGRADLTFRGRFMAAVLACGEGAVLSHTPAAMLRLPPMVRRQDRRDRPPCVANLAAGNPGTAIHDLAPADAAVVHGIPVTSVARTLLALATFQREPQLERACDQAATMRLLDMREMSDLLKRSRGRRGVRRLRDVLSRGDLGENVPASSLEIRYRDLCTDAGLPTPEINRYLLLGDEYHKVISSGAGSAS